MNESANFVKPVKLKTCQDVLWVLSCDGAQLEREKEREKCWLAVCRVVAAIIFLISSVVIWFTQQSVLSLTVKRSIQAKPPDQQYKAVIIRISLMNTASVFYTELSYGFSDVRREGWDVPGYCTKIDVCLDWRLSQCVLETLDNNRILTSWAN